MDVQIRTAVVLFRIFSLHFFRVSTQPILYVQAEFLWLIIGGKFFLHEGCFVMGGTDVKGSCDERGGVT